MYATTRTVIPTLSTSKNLVRQKLSVGLASSWFGYVGQEGTRSRRIFSHLLCSLAGISALSSVALNSFGQTIGPLDAGNTAVGAGSFNYVSGSVFNSAFGYDALGLNELGSYNTAVGTNSMYGNNGGNYNTAVGALSLAFTTGSQNTAVGYSALNSATGNQNTGVGYSALLNSQAGSNTALGWQALTADSTGADNTAAGSSALAFNTTGGNNAAFGYGSLYRNNGSGNTAIGWQSLNANSSGSDNTVSGAQAMLLNTSGIQNSAFGFNALLVNSTGNNNTALGTSALSGNTTGSGNIAMGYQSGIKLTTGSNNIDFGNIGVAAESGVIRLGTVGTHTAAYVAGISTSTLTGAAVYVTSAGQLGVLPSSERYKTAITSLSSTPEKLRQLRPVTFHLKAEPQGTLQYGLIAEEVEKVYPDLVIRDDKGVIQGIRYDELTPILLKEVQQQRRELEQQRDQFGKEIAALKRQNTQIQATLARLQVIDPQVAMQR